jgi:hypothetical protein
MVTFQRAYDAVAARYSGNLWVSLNAAEIAHAIYQELRRMDAEDVAAKSRTTPKSRDASAAVVP